jgi:hypothetical protein
VSVEDENIRNAGPTRTIKELITLEEHIKYLSAFISHITNKHRRGARLSQMLSSFETASGRPAPLVIRDIVENVEQKAEDRRQKIELRSELKKLKKSLSVGKQVERFGFELLAHREHIVTALTNSGLPRPEAVQKIYDASKEWAEWVRSERPDMFLSTKSYHLLIGSTPWSIKRDDLPGKYSGRKFLVELEQRLLTPPREETREELLRQLEEGTNALQALLKLSSKQILNWSGQKSELEAKIARLKRRLGESS